MPNEMLDELTPEELAKIDEMEATDAPIETVEVTDPEPEPAPAEAAATDEPTKDNPASSEDRPDGFVPKQALSEARSEAKQTREELKELKGRFEGIMEAIAQRKPQEPEAPQIPSLDQDPLGHFDQRIGQMEQTAAQQAQFTQAQIQEQQFRDQYNTTARAFASEKPEFNDAYKFFVQDRQRYYTALGMDQQTAIQQLQNDERALVMDSFQKGINPAARIFEASKTLGWTPPEQAPDPKTVTNERAKAQDANVSLSQVTGTGGVKDTLDAEAFAKMSEAEIFAMISKLGPEEADRVMAQFG